jgi:hypothetical protein
MLVVMVAIGTTDLMFALDSIPAIYGLTKEPYLVLTANLFALMGLRQLYFLLGGLLDRLTYLSVGLSIVLGFIGVKLVLEALHANNLPFLNGGKGFAWAPSSDLGLLGVHRRDAGRHRHGASSPHGVGSSTRCDARSVAPPATAARRPSGRPDVEGGVGEGRPAHPNTTRSVGGTSAGGRCRTIRAPCRNTRGSRISAFLLAAAIRRVQRQVFLTPPMQVRHPRVHRLPGKLH